jgi:membrane associated rhomboid family serine protease
MPSGSSTWEEWKDKILYSGNALYQLIFAIVAVFLAFRIIQVFLALFLVDSTLFSEIRAYLSVSNDPMEVLTQPWSLVTYMFLHAGFFHILFNMLIFYWFGRIFQEYLGDRRLISTFILGGIAGAIVFILAYQIFPALAQRAAVTGMVGASAGVMAIVIGAATLLPDFSLSLILIGPVRLKYIAGFMVLISFLGTAGSNAGGEFSHLGGALYGFFYIKQMDKGMDLGEWLMQGIDKLKEAFTSSSSDRKSGFKVHRNQEKPKYKTYPGEKDKKADQKEVDRILDKIAENGYDSLTEEERKTLFKASK